ncbi:MAG TPA: SRPBCC domain-containing protein [Solirubrobacter sp.]|nr:SRPBCC domain-containing protein [Solirubrobacter sp.]
MRQEFQETVRLAGPRKAVWRTVSDIPSVLSWISIVGRAEEVESQTRYRALLEDRMGPFKLRADLDIAVDERVDGERIRARADGEDRQIGSRLIIDVTLALRDEADGTSVDVRGAYEVTGRPATLGASSIRKKAQKVLTEFFASAERALA